MHTSTTIIAALDFILNKFNAYEKLSWRTEELMNCDKMARLFMFVDCLFYNLIR